LTRRANQRHDAIIAARVIGGVLAKFTRTGAIRPHARFWRGTARQFGKVDIPQEAFITALEVDS
jgi:hypothetical protein